MKGQIIVNGLPLALGHVGLASYTRRLCWLLVDSFSVAHVRVLLPSYAAIPDFDLPREIIEHVDCVPLVSHNLVSGIQMEWSIGRYAERKYPDGLFFSPGPFSAPLPRRSIVVLHDVIYRRFRRYDGKFFIRGFFNRLPERVARKAARVLTVSEFSRKEIAATTKICPDNILVVHNWLEESFFSAPSQTAPAGVCEKYKLPRRFWLYLGGYDYRKNVEFLIRAYAEAVKKVPCPPLVLAGKIPMDLRKPYCDVYRTLAETGMKPGQIIMPGFIEDSDLPELYRSAELFVFPSLMEGFGYTPAEAMTCGCPTFVADNSSLREVVADAGYRFSTDSASRLTNMLASATLCPPKPNACAIDLSAQRAQSQLLPILEKVSYQL